MPALRLEVADFVSPDRWRWVLKEPGGAFLADHPVALDQANPKYPALIDLPLYLHRNSTPVTRQADERRLLHEVGAWIAESVLGRSIAEKLRARAKPSVIVRVLLPPQADRLLTLPLEIARLGNDALSAAGVSFVFEIQGAQPPPVGPIGDRLRMLALFSLPPAGNPLNLRRERQTLRDLVRNLVGARGLGVELQVLQYGVTRDSLRDVLQQAEGWDVIHFSGHGQPGSLLLEQADGRPDPVSSTDVADLLAQGAGRLKLVTLSACLSAAPTIDQTLGWLGLAPEASPRADTTPDAGATEPAKAAPTVARALTETVGCAVLAMRYAVADEFATILARELYDRLFRQKQPLPVATRQALASVANKPGAPSWGALSLAAPALFGASAADLTLVPPPRQADAPADLRLAFIPKQKPHFVGRVAAMTLASAALAPDTDRSGVLFYGMAGAGKTSCAVELVYHHASAARFERFAWYSAPEQGKDITLALRDFALVVEKHVGLPMLHVIDREDEFRDWLPLLIEALENRAVLLVLDNLESLLTDAGQWRDPRWGLLIEALLTPGGLSRTLLTSRTRPAGLPASTEILAIHALPLNEALLLVNELPNLRRLLDGQGAPDAPAGRQLVRRVLHVVQGHPKLIDLAEAMATDPAKLAAQLDEAEAAQTAGEGALSAFFTKGATQLDADAFTTSLRGWTSGAANALPEPARLFFHFLCALEEGDREGWIIQGNWSDVWKRLGHPPPAPDPAGLLAMLTASGLVERQATGTEAEAYAAVIHAGVAEAGRAEAGAALQEAVDLELAATWNTVATKARQVHGREAWAGPALERAGLAAFPYLARLRQWEVASGLLERLVQLDRSPDTIASVLPLVQRVVTATAGTGREATDRVQLAKVLTAAGRIAEAEALLREVIALAADRGEFATASVASGDLANLLRDRGRLTQALHVLEKKAEFSRRAGSGPWTQLLNEGQQLQLRNDLGEYGAVLTRVTEIVEEMQDLPDPPQENDWSINVWNVREATLDTGRTAAVGLGEWQEALDLNARSLQRKAHRGAGALELANFRFNDYGPLLKLQRYAEADNLLQDCQRVFEHFSAVQQLGLVFSARADLASTLGYHEQACRFEWAALRYKYASGTADNVSISHLNLPNYLTRLGEPWRDVLAHRLAATLIRAVTGSGRLAGNIAALAQDLDSAGQHAASALPSDFASLCATVEQVEGVRFRDLMHQLQPDEDKLHQLLHDIIATAQSLQ